MDTPTKSRSPIDNAAKLLRDIALGLDEGELIGSEDELIGRLGVSRITVRQTARLLEREGVLRVRRGINGGYFAARPSVEMVESVVCAYLDTLGLDPQHTGGVATALWLETLRQASQADRTEARALVARLRAELESLPVDSSMREVGAFERSSRTEIFRLIDAAYIEVFFGINSAFSQQQVTAQYGLEDSQRHSQPEWFERWRKAKAMELEAIAEGDEMLAMTTALHTRKVWLSRGVEAWSAARASQA